MANGPYADIQTYIRHLEQQTQDQAETIRNLNGTIADLRQTIANLQETLDELKRKLFGTSSERMGQKTPDEEPGEETPAGGVREVPVKEHIRKRKPKSTREDLYEALPVRRVECPVPEDDRDCPDCGAPMDHLGWQFGREELRITPAKVERVQYYYETLICPECRKEDDTTIIRSGLPTPLLMHSPASASMVAAVMYDKSGLYLPFYRQEKDWDLKKVPLPRETIANWYNQCSLKYLFPIYDALHAKLLAREVIHADEVPCQVLREKGREPEQKSYF